jgi:hypothetical protein
LIVDRFELELQSKNLRKGMSGVAVLESKFVKERFLVCISQVEFYIKVA